MDAHLYPPRTNLERSEVRRSSSLARKRLELKVEPYRSTL